MRKNKHIRPLNPYNTKVEIDLPDGKTIVVEAIRVNYGHNDFGTQVYWSEKKEP